jgi:hypothetical protein
MACTIDQLLSEVLRLRGPLVKRPDPFDSGLAGYDKVWDAFNRYLTETISKRQTLNIPNFCKIGWRVEEQLGPKHGARLRPHFQLADGFSRVYGLESKTHAVVADMCLAKIEEFNFSKAAIKYSQNLTKENFFLGLRAIVQHIGEVIAHGMSVSLDFEIGKLLSNDRDVRFAFESELYRKEGLDVPDCAVQSIDYKPSVTFAPPSKDALGLSLQGAGCRDGDVRACAFGGFDDRGGPIVSIDDNARNAEKRSIDGKSSDARGACQASLGPAGFDQVPAGASMSPGCTPQEACRHAALYRHKKLIESEAARAYEETSQWEEHLKRCVAEDKRDAECRRALAVEHSDQLRAQMQQVTTRRVREESIEQASTHDFPNFRETPETTGIFEYMRERRANLRQDLDQQVKTKQLALQAEKDRDRLLEAYHVEASKRELEQINEQKAGKRQAEMSGLRDAWSRDAYLKNVRKAIHDHDPSKVLARKGDISELVANTASISDDWQGISMLRSPTASKVSWSFGGGSAPPTPRPPPTPRGALGGTRRLPIGAAASLALQKERLNRTMR